MNDGKKRKEKTISFSAWKTMEMSLKIIRIKKFSTETNSVVWMCLRQHCINNDCQAIAVWFSFDFNEISQSQTRVRLCKKILIYLSLVFFIIAHFVTVNDLTHNYFFCLIGNVFGQ